MEKKETNILAILIGFKQMIGLRESLGVEFTNLINLFTKLSEKFLACIESNWLKYRL